MNTSVNQQPATMRDWLNERGGTETASHHIARALGIRRSDVEPLLSAAPTADALLNLNRLAQHRHLALANRVWPHCTWLDWQSRQGEQHPVIDLIRRVFGRELLDYVSQTFGSEIVVQYWNDLIVPAEYDDITVVEENRSPVLNVPDEQMVSNPYSSFEKDEGELFIFGTQEAAACFRWLIESRHNYSHYVDNRTGYINDPMGIQLAFDLRRTLKEEYWAALPPDTLPAYLAIACALQAATVPEEYQEGRLPPLSVVKAATLPADRLAVVQTDDRQMWLVDADALTFDQQPAHLFVLEPETDEAPAGLILTTHTEPGNPEQHRASPPARYLHRSRDTMLLAFVPHDRVEHLKQNLGDAEEVIHDTLSDVDYGVDAATGIFCICRFNPFMSAGYDEPIAVYRIPGGYMLQFNPDYSFSPQEMAVD